MTTIVSAMVGTNSDIFPSILDMHLREQSVVADVTYGKGRFWRDVVRRDIMLFATDIAEEPVCPNDAVGWIVPEGGWQQDFRSLAYPDEYLNGLVLDPPYMYNPKQTIKNSIADCYNINDICLKTTNDVINYYVVGIQEAHRVLKDNGILIVKCQDNIESGRQRWVHKVLMDKAEKIGFECDDLFVLVQSTVPAMRWKKQYHARKNHSYFLVFVK